MQPQETAVLMTVPSVNLRAQYTDIKEELDRAVLSVLAEQRFILGAQVEACERDVAAYSNASFGCGVSSGTDALLLSMTASGIGPGDEVIVPAFSFFATAGCVARLGARPVFADIDPQTFNIDPKQITQKISPRTKAIIPVHLFGQTADMAAILGLSKAHRLTLIEDAAQAIGADSEIGRAGAVGDFGCLSFFPTKNLGGFGDGGMVLTNDAARAKKLKMLRVHGQENKYEHRAIGGNFRLDALQAVVVRTKLKHLDNWTKARIQHAKHYTDLLLNSETLRENIAPPAVWQPRHVFNQYVIRANHRRDELMRFLAERGIGSEIYYPTPLPFQPCFESLGHHAGEFPESERAAREVLTLPIHPELTDEQIDYVVKTAESFYQKAAS